MLIGTASAPDNTVAILALVVSAIVGMGSPVLLSLFALKRQTRDFDAEHDRLAITLAADQRKLRYMAEREVLDGGAMLLAKYRSVMTGLEPAETRRQVIPTKDVYEVHDEVAVHRLRLRLWFKDDDDVVKAFDEILACTGVYAEKWREPKSELRDATVKVLNDELTKKQERYLSAARTQLRGDQF